MTFVVFLTGERQATPKSFGYQRPIIRFPVSKARIIAQVLLKPLAETTQTGIGLSVHAFWSGRKGLPEVRNPVQT
jgi:hypothetical protein